MEEKILKGKRHGLLTLCVCIAAIVSGVALMFCGTYGVIIGVILLVLAFFPLLGLKVLKPNEALVLTLFGKYVGTLKGEGFIR